MGTCWIRIRTICLMVWQWLFRWRFAGKSRRRSPSVVPTPSRLWHPIQPKPKWVKQEVIRLKALLPQAGCRTIAHRFNRRWAARRAMTVSKTYVADLCRRHQYLIYEARRKLKHRIPRPIARSRVGL